NSISMVFLDFEKPLEHLHDQLEKVKELGTQGNIDISKMTKDLEVKIKDKRKEIYTNLTGWQKVQLSRHPERPYTLYYIQSIFKKFIELHGDRNFKDDKAIIGGL